MRRFMYCEFVWQFPHNWQPYASWLGKGESSQDSVLSACVVNDEGKTL
jgi:hypothetical protein